MIIIIIIMIIIIIIIIIAYPLGEARKDYTFLILSIRPSY